MQYDDVDVWECPPNGQGVCPKRCSVSPCVLIYIVTPFAGLTALLALNILKNIDLNGLVYNSAGYLHIVIEVHQDKWNYSMRVSV